MATENNLVLNNHNVHQEEKEDNLHDLDMDTNVQNNEDHSQIMEMVEQGTVGTIEVVLRGGGPF